MVVIQGNTQALLSGRALGSFMHIVCYRQVC